MPIYKYQTDQVFEHMLSFNNYIGLQHPCAEVLHMSTFVA